MSDNQTCFTRNIDKIFEDSQYTGELILTGRKLKHFPRNISRYDLIDIYKAELSHNQFCDVPGEACCFYSLEVLNLSHNCIRSLPFTITNLKELVELNISNNQLSTFPAFICQHLHHLQILTLSGNKLTCLPDEIGQLMKLSLLDVSNNELSVLPNQLGDLCSLRDLNLRRNMLIELPICLSRLKLYRLDISCNRIAHIPCDFRKVTTLEVIRLEGNPLVSPPAQLCLRGLIHIMKFLYKEATKHESRSSINTGGSLQRRLKRSSSFSATSDNRMGGFDRVKSYNLGNAGSLYYNNVINNPTNNNNCNGNIVNHVNIYNNNAIVGNSNINNVNCVGGRNKSSTLDYHERSKSLKGDILSNVANYLNDEYINNNNNNNDDISRGSAKPSSLHQVQYNSNNNQLSLLNDIKATTNILKSNNDSNASDSNNSNKINTNGNILINGSLINNIINTSSASLSTTKTKLTTQANAASQQLELWLNGLQQPQQQQPQQQQQHNMNRNDKSNITIDPRNKANDNDAISKQEFQRQKAEYDSKKKKVEVLKQRLDAAKSDAERNIILQQHLNEINSFNNNITTNNSNADAVINGVSNNDKQASSAIISPSSTSSSSSIPPSSIPSSLSSSSSNGWSPSNANTLPRCGPGRETFEQAFAKPRSKLQNFKVPMFRKSTISATTNNNNEDNIKVNGTTNNTTSNTNSKSNNTNQSKLPGNRTNGVTSSDSNNNNTGSKNEIVGGKWRETLSEKERTQVEKMRRSMETLLKTSLPPETLESSLRDGVILCHLINIVRPRAVPCIHVASHTAPVLSAPKVRRNVDNFLLACKRAGVDQNHLCSASSITDEFNIVAIASTINALISSSSFASKSTLV